MTDFLDFFSGKNYMKRAPSSGTANLSAPATSIYLGSTYITQRIIPHGLAHTPTFCVSGELYGDGIIWETRGSRLTGSTSNPLDNTKSGPYLIAWADATNLTIEIGYSSNTLPGTFPVYWDIYKDYGIA